MFGKDKLAADPTETEPLRGIRYFGTRLQPKRCRFGTWAPLAEAIILVTTSEILRCRHTLRA